MFVKETQIYFHKPEDHCENFSTSMTIFLLPSKYFPFCENIFFVVRTFLLASKFSTSVRVFLSL